MKEYYEKRFKEFMAIAQEYELKAEKEMQSGSGAQAMEYCKLADAQKLEARKFKEALEAMA